MESSEKMSSLRKQNLSELGERAHLRAFNFSKFILSDFNRNRNAFH